MKNQNTFADNYLFITKMFVFIMLLFLSGENIANDGCDCNGTVVKFNWEDDEFVLEEDHHANGIEIFDVQLDEEGEPICVTWISHDNWVMSVCIKAGVDGNFPTSYPSPGSDGETNCKEGQNAISHIEFCIDGPLPVEMTSFSANVSNNLAQLNWETATEVNNYGFEIQKSADIKLWDNIGFVEGHGNSNSPKYYSFTDNSTNISGTYSYRLKQVDIDGSFDYSDIVEITVSAPLNFNLNQNYPNPFNPTTTINYSIPEDGFVTLSIYDVLGNEVAQIENGNKVAGSYSNSFDASKLTSGLYFYTIRVGNFVETKKMILMK